MTYSLTKDNVLVVTTAMLQDYFVAHSTSPTLTFKEFLQDKDALFKNESFKVMLENGKGSNAATVFTMPEFYEGLHFMGVNFAQIKGFNGKQLQEVIFEHCTFPKDAFRGSTLEQVTFKECNLSQHAFNEAKLTDCTLTESNLKGSKWKNSLLRDCNLDRTELQRADFSSAIMNHVTFRGANAAYMLVDENTVLQDCNTFREASNHEALALANKRQQIFDKASTTSWLVMLGGLATSVIGGGASFLLLPEIGPSGVSMMIVTAFIVPAIGGIITSDYLTDKAKKETQILSPEFTAVKAHHEKAEAVQPERTQGQHSHTASLKRDTPSQRAR